MTGFALDRFLPYRLAVTSQRLSRLFARRYEAEFGLSIAEWRMLALLGERPGITASEVVILSTMDKAKVSRAAAGLAEKGLLRRRVVAGDRRTQGLTLTAAGQRVYQGIIPVALAMEAEVLAEFPPDERAALDRALLRLGARIRAMGGEEG